MSYSGEERTTPVAEAVDVRLRTEPGFKRDFDDALHIAVGDGTPEAEGRLRFRVKMTIPGRFQNRRVPTSRKDLADFVVVCAPSDTRPCVDAVLARARSQARAMKRILAASPRA